MTVLIAAAGEAGETAALALVDRDVTRVETAEAAREELSGAAVVVVGDLAEGSPAEVREAARQAGVPVVRLAEDGGEGATVPPGNAGALRDAVGLAERVSEYRDAVDAFYEQCRAHAEGDDDDDLHEARTRAHRRFHELRDAAGRTPYEQVLGDQLQDAEQAVPDDRQATEDDESQE